MATSPRAVLRPVSQHLQLDKDAILRFLKDSRLVDGDAAVSQLTLHQFGHGQSNPTYLVRVAGREFVLRKQPPGKLLASAHAVHREFAVISALTSSPVPVPRALKLCTDARVLGAKFYVMSFVDGPLFLDPSLPGLASDARARVYTAMAETLADLHSIDPASVGLENYGRPAHFSARQVSRWKAQYLASTAEGSGNARLPSVLRLAEWLEAHAGEQDALLDTPRIVHGDYRLDNLVYESGDLARANVAAVLDWELSTLGDPLCDLAGNCLIYHLPTDLGALRGLPQPLPAGVPSEQEYIATYCARRGVAPPTAEAYAFHKALALFRAAAILAGVYARSLQGNASSANAAAAGAPAVVDLLAETALAAVGQQPILRSAAAPAAAPPPFDELPRAQRADGHRTTPDAQPQGGSLAAVPKHLGSPPATELGRALLTRLRAFMAQHIIPADVAFEAHAHNEHRWQPFPQMESLKRAARTEGLWNLWIPPDLRQLLEPCITEANVTVQEAATLRGPGLTNEEYAHLARAMGSVTWCPEVFNCSAPDTGNMEVLARYGSAAQQAQWLVPLLRGDVRSCFAMTEPSVASSDATNIQGSVKRDGEEYVVTGRKVWISGACDARCAICIFMGKSDASAPVHRQQCMVLVPMDAAGAHVVRPMTVFGQDDAPHGHAEMRFDDVRVPLANMILGEGRGFEIAQGRLGPGRLHHCMRAVGIGEAALALVTRRVQERKAFGATLAKSALVQAQIADAWLQLHTAWLAVLHAAGELDRCGNREARLVITAAKVVVPRAVLHVIDTAIQLHGAAGVGQDTKLGGYWGAVRTLRLADGPDEVHRMAIGKQVIQLHSKL